MRRCARLKCEAYAEDNGVYCHAHKHAPGRTRRSGLHPVAIVAGLLIVLLVLALFSKTVFAATYYRDRFIPGGVCMVDFYGSTVNASLIQQVRHGQGRARVGDYKYSGFFDGSKDISTYRPAYYMTLVLVNGQSYNHEITADVAERDKLAFLKQIEDKCK